MLINSLKLKTARKKRKTIGRGGRKGTYCGKGNKGQKARSGAHVDPLFEGGRSTLVDHMKKKKGFTSKRLKPVVVRFSSLVKKFENDAKITIEELLKNNFLKKADAKRGVKILGPKTGAKKFSFGENITFSKSVKK